MSKMIARFFDWIFHPSVRRDPPILGKSKLYRYPSPGNILKKQIPQDYKTPFQNSQYNVRYIKLTSLQTQPGYSRSSNPGINLTPTRKLVLLKMLNQNDHQNPVAIEQAKKKFKSTYGFDVQRRQYENELPVQVPDKNDREAIKTAIATDMITASLTAKSIETSMQHQSVNHPDILNFQSLDLYDSPHFMQSRIQNQYYNDSIEIDRVNEAKNHGGLRVRTGSSNFWKALDDSNDPANIAKVQGKVKDPTPLDFDLRNGKVKFQFDKDGKVINMERIESPK